jgi:4'-phosphopantetheinyl transferase
VTPPDIRQWQQSTAAPPLTSDAVHVWLVALDAPQPVVTALRGNLSPDELDRAGRFVFERHQNRFIVGRACLRILLGGYVGTSPRELEFHYGPCGKPELAGKVGQDGVHFNLAHSKGTALLGVTSNREIGIDVEHWRSMTDGKDIAERFFAPAEIEQLDSLQPEHWQAGFFACWTRKEAYIKARGEGLSIPLNEFAITVQSDNRVAILHSEIDPNDVDRWSVEELLAAPECSGAVVVEGLGWSLQLLRLPDWPDQIDDLIPLIRHSL